MSEEAGSEAESLRSVRREEAMVVPSGTIRGVWAELIHSMPPFYTLLAT